MFVVLTGENVFALKRELALLTGTFIDVYGDIAVERLDGEEASFERLQESLQSPPFLEPKKLVVIRSAGANKPFIEHLEELLAAIPETTDLIIVEPKIDKRSTYFRLLKQRADFRNFTMLDEQGMAHWLVAAATERGGLLEFADARLLVERVGTDQQLLDHELDKLLTYDQTVTKATIELLTDLTPQGKVFDLLEAAFAGRLDQTLSLYRDQREQKVDPSQIIALLAWQLKMVALVKTAGKRSTGDIVRDAKIGLFSAQKAQNLAKHINLVQLKALINELLILDIRSKREMIDLDEALQNYLFTLSAS